LPIAENFSQPAKKSLFIDRGMVGENNLTAIAKARDFAYSQVQVGNTAIVCFSYQLL
jgi:hypothetical protein